MDQLTLSDKIKIWYRRQDFRFELWHFFCGDTGFVQRAIYYLTCCCCCNDIREYTYDEERIWWDDWKIKDREKIKAKKKDENERYEIEVQKYLADKKVNV